MSTKPLRLRRDGVCVDCGLDLAAGQMAVWFPTDRVIRCLACSAALDGPVSTQGPSPSAAGRSVAGGSAQREYDRRSERERSKQQAVVDEDEAWRTSIIEQRPILGRVAAAIVPRPPGPTESHSTTAWRIGAEGERRVGEVLDSTHGVEVLHDRRVPHTRANIDHLVIGPSGVFVIDAKKYTGRVELRDRGGLFRRDVHLYVNGRDRSALVDGVLDQMEEVRRVLDAHYPTVEVHGLLCFVGCEWGMFKRPKQLRGVTALWPTKLLEHITIAGPYASLIPAVAFHLGEYLPPAV